MTTAAALPRATLPGLRLNSQRIAANSATLAAHILVLGLLLMPSAPPSLPAHRPEPPPPLQISIPIVIPKIVPAPSPPTMPVQHRPLPPVIPQAAAPSIPDLAPSPMDSATDPASADDQAIETTQGDPSPALDTLAYDQAPPPRYPIAAMRAGQQGEVLLRVLVDANGHVLSVAIERSSGHPLLDRAARQHVLARWRFHPAQRNGIAISAIGVIPIVFSLPR